MLPRGECEPIKILDEELAYVPNHTQHASLLTRSKPHTYWQAIGPQNQVTTPKIIAESQIDESKTTNKITATKQSKNLLLPHAHFIKHLMYMTKNPSWKHNKKLEKLSHGYSDSRIIPVDWEATNTREKLLLFPLPALTGTKKLLRLTDLRCSRKITGGKWNSGVSLGLRAGKCEPCGGNHRPHEQISAGEQVGNCASANWR
jgi:hypothetical protein